MRNVFPHYGQPVEFSGRKKLDVVEIYRRRQIIPLRTSSFSRYVLLRLPCEYPIYIYIYIWHILFEYFVGEKMFQILDECLAITLYILSKATD